MKRMIEDAVTPMSLQSVYSDVFFTDLTLPRCCNLGGGWHILLWILQNCWPVGVDWLLHRKGRNLRLLCVAGVGQGALKIHEARGRQPCSDHRN